MAKNKSNLTKKQIVDKTGKRTSVWVKTQKKETKPKTYTDTSTGKTFDEKQVKSWLEHYESGNVPKKGRKHFELFFERIGVKPKNKGVRQSSWSARKKEVQEILKKVGAPKEFDKDILFIEKRIESANNSKIPRNRDEFWDRFSDTDLSNAMERVGNPAYHIKHETDKKTGYTKRVYADNYKYWKKYNDLTGWTYDWYFGDALA